MGAVQLDLFEDNQQEYWELGKSFIVDSNIEFTYNELSKLIILNPDYMVIIRDKNGN